MGIIIWDGNYHLRAEKLAFAKNMKSPSLVVAGRKAEDMGTNPHLVKFGVFLNASKKIFPQWRKHSLGLPKNTGVPR